MKLSPKAKKWGKRILILLLIRFVVGGILYYVIVYRFKDIMQVVVKKESHGAYAFDAADVTVSLWKKKLVLHDARLICKDSLAAPAHYAVRIPEIYLRINSWSDLIFHRKVSVDSLAIIKPEVYAHQHERHATKQVSFHASAVMNGLHKALKHLQVRSFNLQNGSFSYGTVFTPAVFNTNNINLAVRNFAKQNDTVTHLLAAGEVELQLANQHWTLPAGNAELSFRRLHFSGATETFQLDSCTFRSLDSTKPKISITAEKLFFNSRQLADIYEKEELVIDTLLLLRPVVHLQTRHRHRVSDSAHVGSAFEKMLEGIHFRYVDIKEGQLVFYKGIESHPSYASDKTDLKIFNLSMEPQAAKLTTDSIQLSLHNIRMVTKDSLFEMKVKEFVFRNHELDFKGVSYGPTVFNPHPEGIRFETPLLQLKDIDLENLLHKRLRGSEAVLHRPSITVYNKKQGVHHKKVNDHFYQTLHGVGELIDVDNFHIVNGHLQYRAHGNSDIKMAMKGINAKILLNHFLSGDSLIDIKRAMPDLRIGEMNLESPKLKLALQKYHFEGTVRHNAAESFHLSLANGTDIEGKGLYWWIFDWDMFKNHGIVLVEHMDIHELDMNMVKHEGVAHPGKELPVIFVRRVDIRKLAFKQSAEQGGLSFNAKNICADQFGSEKHFFRWQNASALVNDIVFANKNINASVEQIQFTNEDESVLKNAVVAIKNENLSIHLQLPATKLRVPILSTDMAAFNLESLTMDDPEIAISRQAVGAAKKAHSPLSIPVILHTKQFMVNRGKIKFNSGSEKDSISLATMLDVKAVALKTAKTDEPLRFDSLIVNLTDLSLQKKGIEVDMAKTRWVFANGLLANTHRGISFHTDISGAWTGATAATDLRDSTNLAITGMSGGLAQNGFVLVPGSKMKWQKLMQHVAIHDAAVNMSSRSTNVKVGSLSWSPVNSELRVRSFSMKPRTEMESAFEKAKWQTDYITVEVKQLAITGISFDSIIKVQTMMADGLSLTTTRDKRMPFKGAHKMMPVQLLRSVKHPFHVDSALLRNSSVTVREISAATHKTGIIPLENLHATITGISNVDGAADSLSLTANFYILNNNVRHFYYSEAYNDSLSGFRAGVHAASMPLSPYSRITAPLAAVNVEAGDADTLYASWAGNTHGAIGTMNFHYQGLKVRLLDKKDPSKKHFLLALENWLANSLVLRKSNRDDSRIFFMRDKQKFIFNYWVKTIMHGMMSSVGVKSSRKYLKQYRKALQQYELPEQD